MFKMLDCGLEVSAFKAQLYFHFPINTFGKGMKPIIFPASGVIVSLLFFYKDDLGIK